MCELLVPIEVQKLQAVISAKEAAIADRDRKLAVLLVAVASLAHKQEVPRQDTTGQNEQKTLLLQNQKLEHINKELIATCDKLTTRVETLSSENESLRRDNASFVRMHDKEKQNKVKALADLQQMTIETESLVKKHKMLQKDHRILQETNRKLQEDSDKVKSFQMVLTKANSHLTQHNGQLQQERDDLAAEVGQMRQQVNNLQVQKEQLVREVGRLHAAAAGKPPSSGAELSAPVSPDTVKLETSTTLQALTMPLAPRSEGFQTRGSGPLPSVSVQPSPGNKSPSNLANGQNSVNSGGAGGANGLALNSCDRQADSALGTVPGRLDLLTATLKALNHSSNSQCQQCKDLISLLNTTQQQYQQQHQQYQQSETFFRRVLEEQLKNILGHTTLISRKLDERMTSQKSDPVPINVDGLRVEVEKLKKRRDEMELKGQGLAAEALALRQQLYHAQSKHDELEDSFRRAVAEMLVQAKRVKSRHDDLVPQDYELASQFTGVTDRIATSKDCPVALLKAVKSLEARMMDNLIDALTTSGKKRAAADDAESLTMRQDVGQHAPRLPANFKRPKVSL